MAVKLPAMMEKITWHPMIKMALHIFGVTMMGAGVALIYLRVTDVPDHLPSLFSTGYTGPVFPLLMGGLAVGLIMAGQKRLGLFFDIAGGKRKIGDLDPALIRQLQYRALHFPSRAGFFSLILWLLAGIFILSMDPVAFIFEIPPRAPIIGLKPFLGVGGLCGGFTSLILYYVVENALQPFLPRFFPEGCLPGIFPRQKVSRRFFIAILGLTLIPMPLIGILLFSAMDPEGTPAGHMKAMFTELLVIGLCVMVTAVVLSGIIPRILLRPVDRINQAIAGVNRQGPHVWADIYGADELGHLAQGVNQMITGLDSGRRIREHMGRYLGKEIREEILAGRSAGGNRMVRATVLFADLRAFTRLVETHHPRTVVRILNQYFDEMTLAVRAHGGLVLQFVGDEIEAVFGFPLPVEDHPEMAVKSALAMREGLKRLNRRLAAQGNPTLSHGIGIHSGAVLAGDIGSRERMSYALVGDTVNTASRIQGLTKTYHTDIIISKTTHDLLTESYPARQLSPVRVRGKADGIMLYKLLGA